MHKKFRTNRIAIKSGGALSFYLTCFIIALAVSNNEVEQGLLLLIQLFLLGLLLVKRDWVVVLVMSMPFQNTGIQLHGFGTLRPWHIVMIVGALIELARNLKYGARSSATKSAFRPILVTVFLFFVVSVSTLITSDDAVAGIAELAKLAFVSIMFFLLFFSNLQNQRQFLSNIVLGAEYSLSILFFSTVLTIWKNFDRVVFFLHSQTFNSGSYELTYYSNLINPLVSGGFNLLAAWLVVCQFLIVFYYFNGSTGLREDTYRPKLASIIIGFLFIFLVPSRTNWLALSVAGIYILFKSRSRHRILRFRFAALFVFLVILLFASPIKSVITGRIHSAASALDTGVRSRLTFWKNTIKKIESRPVVGYGYGYATAFARHVARGKYSATNLHNVPLQMAANGGLVLLASYLSIWIVLLLETYRLPNQLRYWAQSLLALIFIQTLFQGQFTETYTWLGIVIVATLPYFPLTRDVFWLPKK
ncbi:MAG: O-antigen ligase family protein [Candidatus Hydrogenedentota bacterium]|nr:MAG: O-antigen ligase family protein [Candidatus Hydrogenedentota bacterium]